MSDTEEPQEPLSHVLKGNSTWTGPVKVTDMRSQCCQVHGSDVSDDRPCFWLDNVLSESECDALLQATLDVHGMPHGDDEVQTDPGCRSQFTCQDPDLSELLWERIRHTIPDQLDGGQVVGLLERVSHSCYFPGQVGFPHMDFRHRHGKNECIASRISFTVYINDNYSGGELSFVGKLHMDGSVEGEHSCTKPRRGSAVLFYQCVPEFAHLPHKVKEGSKSIIRADVMYRFEDSKMADVGGIRSGQA